MAQRASYKKRNGSFSFTAPVAAMVLAVSAFALFFGFGVAQGADAGDDTTLGIGQAQSVLPQDYAQAMGAEDAEGAEAEGDVAESAVPESIAVDGVSDTGMIDGKRASVSSAESLKTPQQRTFTVEDPEPTIVLAAVDSGDPATVAAAAKIGTTHPSPAAVRLKEDTSGDEWLTGVASAYDVASSSTLTYSGRAFDDDCVTVAVPQGMEDYVGRPVEIVWNDMVVIATVTDTGGFAKYGRCLDLGGGVWKAFGCEQISDWGLQTIKYRYL